MQFSYKATNETGEVVEGINEAIDKFDLNRILKTEGLSLLSAEENDGKGFIKSVLRKLASFSTVSDHEKIIFGKNLSSMLEAGLALSRALDVIDRQTKNKGLKKVVKAVSEDIKKGLPLSGALRKHPKIFSDLFVSMVSAGEESGNLNESLNVVASQMEKTLELKKKIRGAMIYPGVILSAMVVIAIFMFIFIVPTLSGTFIELNLELPTSTKIIIAVSDLLKNNTLFMAVGFVVFIGSVITAFKTVRGRRILDWVFLHMPLIKGLVQKTNSARTTRTLSSLLSSGVPYVRSIEITGNVVQNSFYKEVIKKAEKNIQLGLPVAKVFEENVKLFPVFVSEMIAVGEETGELAQMLMKVASYYEAEVDNQTKNMSTIIEPFLMIIIGAGVGFFAVSMISPMYGLVEGL